MHRSFALLLALVLSLTLIPAARIVSAHTVNDDCANRPIDAKYDPPCDRRTLGEPGHSATPMSPSWSLRFGTTENDQPTGVALDFSDNSYVVGNTDGVFPGQTNAGLTDVFLRKYNPDSTEVWTRQFGTLVNDKATAVAVDRQGNSYVTGSVGGILPGQTRSGDTDAFVRKYDPAGTEVWTRQFGTTSATLATAVAVDSNGNIYVVGYNGGTFPGQIRSGMWDAFVRKFDRDGTEVWTRQFGTKFDDQATGVAVDSQGNSYVVGWTNGALPGQTNRGPADAFLRSYDSTGSERWTREFGSEDSDNAIGVSVDRADNSYVAGTIFHASPEQAKSGRLADAYLRSFDSTGTERWTRQFGTNGFDQAFGIAVDTNGNSYVTGSTDGTFAGQTNSGRDDAFELSYDSTGTERWVRQFGTEWSDQATGMAVDSQGNSYVAGWSLILAGQPARGDTDIFLIKFQTP